VGRGNTGVVRGFAARGIGYVGFTTSFGWNEFFWRKSL